MAMEVASDITCTSSEQHNVVRLGLAKTKSREVRRSFVWPLERNGPLSLFAELLLC